MSDVPDMISAVISDDKVEAETHFKNTMAQKIGSALDLKRIEVANSLVQNPVESEPVENTTDEKV